MSKEYTKDYEHKYNKMLANIDWSQPDVAIAKLLNVTSSTVGNLRLKFRGKKRRQEFPYARTTPPVVPYQTVDWSKPNRELAASLNVHITSIERYRRQYAKHTINPNRIPKPEFNWNTIDWTKTNKEIQASLPHHYCKGYIRLKRKELAPHTIIKQIMPSELDWKSVNWNESNEEIGKKLNVTKHTVSKFRQKAGFTITRRHIDWANLDWNLSNNDILNMFKMPTSSRPIVSINRRKYAPHTVRSKEQKWNALTIDWSKSTTQIAEETKYSRIYVSKRRKELAPETVKQKHLSLNLNLDNIDWSQSDLAIAQQLGVVRSTVFLLRKKVKGKSWREEYQHSDPRTPRQPNNYSIDYSSLDWSQPNHALAKLLNINIHNLENNRRKYAPETINTKFLPKQNKADWTKVDWTKSNKEIQTSLKPENYNLGYICRRRKRHSPNTCPQSNRTTPRINWKLVDWTKSNQQIAEELGLKKNNTGISNARKRYSPTTVRPRIMK